MERAELRRLAEATGCAEHAGAFTFLCDPHWGRAEREELERAKRQAAAGETGSDVGWLCIATGGTSGKLRFARHDEQTLAPAVRGFSTFFGISRVNAIDVLPPYHVSGFMAGVRSAATGGRHLAWSWKELERGARPVLEEQQDGWVISLVPTQLQRLLGDPSAIEWLRKVRMIFIGGGPMWPALEEDAARHRLPLSRTYGMSETAAMVAATRPAYSFADPMGALVPLPHASLRLNAEGTIVVEGESVFRGYFPEQRTSRAFETNDSGAIAADGALTIFGRRDAAIITGGKKVQPEDVEAALRATQQFGDVAVLALPDQKWGQAVTACYPALGTQPDFALVEARIAGVLAPHKRPKHYVAVSEWPRNAQGKLNRPQLLEAVQAAIASTRDNPGGQSRG